MSEFTSEQLRDCADKIMAQIYQDCPLDAESRALVWKAKDAQKQSIVVDNNGDYHFCMFGELTLGDSWQIGNIRDMIR